MDTSRPTPDPTQPMLALDHVGFCYRARSGLFSSREHWALRDVSFTLCRGETLGIIGRNGAGKTTLLRLLAGLTEPDRGRLVNNGCTVSMLSLQTGFIPYLSGRENVFLSGMTLGIPKQEIRAKLWEVEAFADLGEAFGQPVRTYSMGMLARLGFSIAFQLSPDIILIDEVLGVGDERFKKKSAAALKDKIAGDMTAVLVTHSPGAVQELCTRLIIIDDGVNVFDGPTDEGLERYMRLMGQPGAAAGCAAPQRRK